MKVHHTAQEFFKWITTVIHNFTKTGAEKKIALGIKGNISVEWNAYSSMAKENNKVYWPLQNNGNLF